MTGTMRGVIPVSSLNERLKVLIAEKPLSSAVFDMLYEGLPVMSFFAYSMRYMARSFEK